MRFEANATLIAICTIVAVFGVQFLFFWLRDRRAPWMAWYAAACIFGAGAVMLYLIPPAGLEFLLLGGGNASRILAFAFMWHGAREFAGRRPEQLVVLLVIAVWMALCSIPAFLASMELRIIASSAAISLFCLLGALEFWRNREERLPSQVPAAIAYLSFGLFAASRIPLVNLTPFPMGDLPVSGPWVAGFGLVVFIHVAFIAALVPTMTRERREMEQRKFALSDPLTGLLNRRAFLDYAERNQRRRKTAGEPLAVLVLDLDHFKSINDRYGHDAGDQMLQHFGAVARGATRSSDLLYRMGGEEFCFVLPRTRLAEAHVVAERIRVRFAESQVGRDGEPITATVSIGIAAVDHAGFDLELLLAAGDAAVYQAKARGRNQTVVAEAAALLHSTPPGREAAA